MEFTYETATRTTTLGTQPMLLIHLPTEILRAICEQTAVLSASHPAFFRSYSLRNLNLSTESQKNALDANSNDRDSLSDSQPDPTHITLPSMDPLLLEAPLYRLSSLSSTCKRMRAIAVPLLFERVCIRRPEYIETFVESNVFEFARWVYALLYSFSFPPLLQVFHANGY